MFFQLDNTPQNVRRKRQVTEISSEVEVPRLQLAPFTSHPTVTFENIPINGTASRTLEVYNPHSSDKQVTIVKLPPADLCLEFSWTETTVLANDIALLELRWAPKAPAGQRFTMQMADEKKRRFDFMVVCKTADIKKPNKNAPKKKLTNCSKPVGIKKSPKSSKSKRSPKTKFYIPCGDKYKNILEITSTLTEEVSAKCWKSPLKQRDIVNICPQLQHPVYTSNTSDVRRDTYLINDPEYDKENDCSFQMQIKSETIRNDFNSFSPCNILSKIDNLEFTPVKTTQIHVKKDRILAELNPETLQYEDNSTRVRPKNMVTDKNKISSTKPSFEDQIDRIDDFSKVEISTKTKFSENVFVKEMYLQNQRFDRTYDENIGNAFLTENRDPKPPSYTANLTHSIIDLCDLTMPSKNDENVQHIINTTITKPTIVIECESDFIGCKENITSNETCSFTPNTKNNLSEMNMSLEFNPKRCSTERKEYELKLAKNTSINEKVSRELLMNFSPAEGLNSTYGRLSSGTYTKGDSPIIALKPSNQSSPYSTCGSPPLEPFFKPPPPNITSLPRKLPFSEESKNFIERNDMKNVFKEKNNTNSVRDIIEANLWQRTPPRPISPTCLATIPEESTFFEVSTFDANKKCETFIVNRTFEIPKSDTKTQVSNDSIKERWSKTGPHKASVKTSIVHRSFKKEDIIDSDVRKDSEYHYTNIKSISTTMDPFLASTCLYDERAYDELQIEFKKWLNYLLTPPADLATNLDDSKMDIGKAWIESRNKIVPAAPTKEQVSAKYHTSHRLESLRKSAKVFSEKQHIREVFIKVSTQVEKKLLAVREEKNIHVNIGLQKTILNLLLCYNPLWLRIGLETLYERSIPLVSNNDIMGLSSFIIEYMFKDPYTNAKHSINMYSQQYVESIKKFTLKKFLFLVYFLDQAKINKIIPHDPCLFCRNAPFKESKQILFQFTKEVIAGVGDITKHLKPTGYVVSHAQTYLHEFKYAVHNIAVDLKDGVRLTKLMEIILMKDNLISNLRTPADTRLRKIHNVKVAIAALESAGFTIVGDITPKDIADGHREKTLSLLWQLINRFRAPLFSQSAIVIQKWWRKKYLRIWIDKRIEYKKNYKFHKASTTIQSWWRGIVARRNFLVQLEIETKASIIIQKTFRMWKCRKQYLQYLKSIIKIQSWYKNISSIRRARTELNQLRLNAAAIKIQEWYRLKKQRQLLAAQNTERSRFLEVQCSVRTIQTAARAYLTMKKERKAYIILRISTIKIQQYYRAVVIRRYVRRQYLQLKTKTIYVQRKFRANLLRNHQQQQYTELRTAVVKIQQFYRSWLVAKQTRNEFLKLKSAAIIIQRKYKAQCAMKSALNSYLLKRQSAIVLQKHIRGYLQMKIDRKNYLAQKELIENQRRENAALIIQQKYRAYLQMETDRGKYLILRSSTIKIQIMFKSYLFGKSIRQEFVSLKNTAIFIQRKYRAKLAMLTCLKRYEEMRSNALIIQRFYRSYVLVKKERESYLAKKQAAIVIQSRFKGLVARREYVRKINAAILIQSYFRMINTKKKFEEMKESAVCIQRFYRNLLLMREIKKEYEMTRLHVIKIQSLFRMYIERKKYLQLHYAVTLIQKLYRIKLENNRQKLLRQTFASVVIQTAWRRYIQYKQYEKLKASAIVCQEVWRSILMMRKQRDLYNHLRMNVIKLQAAARGYLLRKSLQVKQNLATKIQSVWKMYKARKHYKSLRTSAIIYQQRWRAMLEMRKCKNEFAKSKHAIIRIQALTRGYLVRSIITRQMSAAVKIQTAWRSYSQNKKYIKTRCAAVVCQRWWRSVLCMKKQRAIYCQTLSTVIHLQSVIRGYLVRRTIARNTAAAVKIQSAFRKYIAYRRYQQILTVSVFIQRKWRALLAMKLARDSYRRQKINIIKLQAVVRGYLIRRSISIQKSSAIRIQAAWKCYIASKHYKNLKEAVSICQQRRRSITQMRQQKKMYTKLRSNIIQLQARIKGNLVRQEFSKMRQEREELNRKRIQNKAALVIQRNWRGYLVRKKEAIAQDVRVAELRKRWQEGALESDQLTLAERNQDAMEVLCHFRDVASVIRAFKSLDYVTNVYPMMYSTGDTALPIITHLVAYMGATNRSVSTLETLQLGAAILLNLTKYSPTAHYVYKVEHVETVLMLMLHWCDKDNLLSRLFCTLLWMFGKYDDIRKDLSNYLNSPKPYKILCKVRIGLIRRRRMESRKRTSIHSSLPGTPCLSKSFNDSMRLSMTPVQNGRQSLFQLPMTPIKSGKHYSYHLPATEPDYGIERRNQPKLFTDEIQGIDAVFLKFELPLNYVSML